MVMTTTYDRGAAIQKLGELVFDTIAELDWDGETTLDFDSAQGIELRNAAMNVSRLIGNDPPLLAAARAMAKTIIEWIWEMKTFADVKNASRTYEEQRLLK